MGTPITISSSGCSTNGTNYLSSRYNLEKHEIGHDSSESCRVPANLDRNNRYIRSDSNTTLSNIQKVTDWINSIEGDAIGGEKIDLPNVEEIQIKEPPPRKNVIFMRCEFNRSVTLPRNYYSSLEKLNYTSPLMTYIKNKDRKVTSPTRTVSKKFEKVGFEDVPKPKIPYKDTFGNCSGIERSCENFVKYNSAETNKNSLVDKGSFQVTLRMNGEKSDCSSDVCEAPSSIENQKRELCSYLKLMNPADKKEILILQNRRSTRVRNLVAIQERRQLDKQIRELEEKIEQEEEKCPTLKSFKELNMQVHKPGSEQADTHIPGDESQYENSFHFPFPPRHLTINTEYFDSVMLKLVPRFKRICNRKNIKFYAKTKVSLKNKENIIKNKILKSKFKSTNTNHHNEKKVVKSKVPNIVRKNAGIKFTESSLKSRIKNNSKCARLRTLRSSGKLKDRSLRLMERNLKQWKKTKRKEKLNRDKTERTECTKSGANLGSQANPIVVPEDLDAHSSKRKEPHKTKQDSQSMFQTIVPNIKDSSPDDEQDVRCLSNDIVFPPQLTQDMTPTYQKSSSQREIVTVVTEIREDPVDLENFMDDLNDFNNLSEEHRRCLIESRIFSTKPIRDVTPFQNVVDQYVDTENLDKNGVDQDIEDVSPLYGFTESDVNHTKVICDSLKNSLHEKTQVVQLIEGSSENSALRPGKEEASMDNGYKDDTDSSSSGKNEKSLSDAIEQPSDISTSACSDETVKSIHQVDGESNLAEMSYSKCTEVHVETLPKKNNCHILPYDKSVEIKSLQKSLQFVKKKQRSITIDWDTEGSPNSKLKRQSHNISIKGENGKVLRAFYVDHNLIICQEFSVSLWMQTPLGNILGSQNMWIPRGQTQRIVLNNKCFQKESTEMVHSTEINIAYIELWTKEHKSEIREGPVADIFVTIYFWKQRQNGLDKKVLQLENINGFAEDVQYCVLKNFPKIIVSWHTATEDSITTKQTFIHAYQLAPDYQMITHISDIEPVDHYVSSLHNVEDCDNLIIGCGDNKITLWNAEYGYTVATIEFLDITAPLATLWVKCDRGFLFAIQQCLDRELRLIAINGINHSWKKLASYVPAEGFDRLKGVCIENGLLLSFYDQGILCWKAETGEPVEEISSEIELIPSGSYVILLEGNQIAVKHATTHVLSVSLEDSQ